MQEKRTLSGFQVILMSVAAGVSVANIYYNQPILKDIAESFNVTEGKVGTISMLSQIGYGLGLFFLVPLGDKINKKNLILTLLSLLFITLLLMALSASITEVLVLSLLIGILSVSVQVILPMAASLDSVNRGRTVGTIFTGILIGILAARVFSGFVAEWMGWRYVYGISAGLILSVLVLLRIYLPDVRNEFKGHYFQLLQSALLQIKRFSLLREASLVGGLLFGVFCSFWTTLTFHLSGAPFNFHANVIGLFGLVAIAGALMAPVFGKLA
ncbi:MAG TPA: MFS transporter, partial [Bacteroidales bacterium]